jgi:Pregnancy-associated plasma protein-A
VWLSSPLAMAGGGRKVPDLRRDAASWMQPQGARMMRLPVTVHLATESGHTVTTRADVAAWVARANDELAEFGIEVDVVAVRRMPAGFSSVMSWQTRRQLAALAPQDGTIHVFAIEDLDDGRRMRRIRGLHWRYRGLARALRGREYVVVTREAPSTTLAHEFGHLFGLRHTRSVDNIMCSCRRGAEVSFTDTQGTSMRDGARRYIARAGGPGRMTAGRRDRR